MTHEESVGVSLSEADAALLARILEAGSVANDEEIALGDADRLGRFLLAQIASVNFNPAAIASVVDDGAHPRHARRYAALTETNVRKSWPEQERRVIARCLTAKLSVAEAAAAKKKADTRLQDAIADHEEVRAELALMRLKLALRGVHEAARAAVDAGPLVTLMLAVLGASVEDESEAHLALRADVKRTNEILTRRISDDAFLHSLGQLIRDFVGSYDEVAGADRRLSVVAAERVREEVLRDRGLLARITAAQADAAPVAAEDDELVASDVERAEAPEAAGNADEEEVHFPF